VRELLEAPVNLMTFDSQEATICPLLPQTEACGITGGKLYEFTGAS